jgi:urease accessory protein
VSDLVSAIEQRATPAPARGWRGRLELAFGEADGRTILKHRRHEGPLLVQRPFFPEGPTLPHVYIVSPPGGVVGGDRLEIDVLVERNASALLTTPAATKVYRAGGAHATASQRLVVQSGGALEWFPQETIAFDGADVMLSTVVELEVGAEFMGWEILCLGRPASNAPFTNGTCQQRLEVWVAGAPLYLDRARIDGGAKVQHEAWGLGGHTVTACFVAVTKHPDAVAAARDAASQCAAPGRIAVTSIGGAVICRYLGDSAEQARALLGRAWSALRPLVRGRVACSPRIWST